MKSNAVFAREQYKDEEDGLEKLDRDYLLDDDGNLTHDVEKGSVWLVRKGFPVNSTQKAILEQFAKGKINGKTALSEIEESRFVR